MTQHITSNNVHQSRADLANLLYLHHTALTELMADHATNKALLDEALFKLDWALHMTQNHSIDSTNPVFAANTNDIKNTETATFVAGGVPYTLADNTNCDTGTTKTITIAKYGAFRIDATDATTLTAVWAGGDGTLSAYASSAAAVAAVKALAPVAGACPLGICVILAGSALYTAGTTSVTGGGTAGTDTYVQFFQPVAMTGTSSASTLTSSLSGYDVVVEGNS